jgi:hypothetical protein
MIPLIAGAVFVWLVFMTFVISLCRVAAAADLDADNFDNDVCPCCDGHLEFDDYGSNICLDCGVTTLRSS